MKKTIILLVLTTLLSLANETLNLTSKYIILKWCNTEYISSPKLMDSTSKTHIETSLDEEISDENLLDNNSDLFLKNTKLFTGFKSSIPLVDQLYLNNIFNPPKFS